ncbi:MAG: AraC family transcriptional regulator [Clostridia bacterium]|nr:AraC family transcriptional regulator [Clostridia bacterium]
MNKSNYVCFTADEYIGDSSEIFVTGKIEKTDFPLHWHDFFEIEIIVGGSGSQNLNGNEYELKRGCAYLLSPTDYHSVKANPEIEMYNIMFHESLLSDDFLLMITEKNTNCIFYFDNQTFDEILALCKIIEAEFQKNGQYKNEILRNLLECFLILFLRNISPSVKPHNESNHIQKALLYIQLHFKENPSLIQTAKVVSLNPNYFSKIFKSIIGSSYNEYLTSLKLSYAKKLLISNRLTITEICFASGFTSVSNFMKVFKQKTGVSPKMYAKSKLN